MVTTRCMNYIISTFVDPPPFHELIALTFFVFFGVHKMRTFILAATLAALTFHPVYAEEDCDKTWNAYDLNSDGYLKGDEARKFRDDMNIRGITVGDTKDGSISANQYAKACESDFWEKISEDTR